MQYQSILRLFEYCNIDYGNNIDAGRIKKILSAEFSIAPGGIITIDNFDYSKNDISAELELHDFSERLRCHKLIWENQSLLNYLEQNDILFKDIGKWVGLQDDADFVRFVSPYFANSFDKVMGKILNLPNLEDARRWMDLFVFVDNPEDKDKALNSLRIFLIDTTKMLRNCNDITYLSFIQQINIWADQSSGSFLNKLPASLYKIKDDLVRALVDFTYRINRQNVTLCYAISCELIRINGIDSELQNVILHNHKVYSSKTKGKKDSKNISFGQALVILIPIIVVIFWTTNGIVNSGGENKHNPTGIDFSTYELNIYDKITSADFSEIRNKFATVGPAMFNDSIIDNDQKLFATSLQYIMVERADTCHSTVVNIVNNSKDCAIVLYVMSDKELIDIKIDKDNALSINTNKNALDFAFRIINKEKSFPLARERTAATLVSDLWALNTNYHVIDFDNKDKIINIDKVSDEKGLTLEVYSMYALNSDSVLHINNYMTFRNAEWCSFFK